MDVQLTITTNESAIGPVCDFTYSWCLQCGMSKEEANRFTVAVSELVTNIILFAYPGDNRSLFVIRFQSHSTMAELIVTETGEPFDPDRHQYDPIAARERDHFEGAGFRLIQAFCDEFLFINKGKKGKEFRLIKRIDDQKQPIDELLEQAALKQPDITGTGPEPSSPPLERYSVTAIEPSDAEDISKLIYRTYNYTYSKEDMYFPKKIEEAVAGNKRMGVIARTDDGKAIGYFAVLKKMDSNLAEVGEAVVSPEFRRRGIMGAMMKHLIEMGRQQLLTGLFGKAVTIHPVSQKVNAKYGFKTTAIMLAETSNVTYIGFNESYPQPVSVLIDFLPISKDSNHRQVYLPEKYRGILLQNYKELGMAAEQKPAGTDQHQLTESSEIRLEIDYVRSTAQLVAKQYGTDFIADLFEVIHSLKDQKMNALYLDLPLENPATPEVCGRLDSTGFIFSGLLPQFHGVQDYLRLQKVYADLDLSLIDVYSDSAKRIKAIIDEEYHRNR